MEDPPTALKTKVNGTPGNAYFSWTPPTGAQFFGVQYTTDLSGAARWTAAEGTSFCFSGVGTAA